MAILKIRDESGQIHEVPAIKGNPGYTPVKGVDYWTSTDKAEIVSDTTAAIDLSNYATHEDVEMEIASFDFIKVLTHLPEGGYPNRIFLVPKTDTQTQDLFDEYVWVNKGTEETPEWGWEWITTKQVEVDLTSYTTKTELTSYATKTEVEKKADKTELPVDTGWIELPVNTTNFQIHSKGGDTNDGKIRYRAIGQIVSLKGKVNPNPNGTLIGTKPGSALNPITSTPLPQEYRPATDLIFICQGSAENTWLLTITTDGAINFSRYRKGGEYTTLAEGTWLPFNVTYIAK